MVFADRAIKFYDQIYFLRLVDIRLLTLLYKRIDVACKYVYIYSVTQQIIIILANLLE